MKKKRTRERADTTAASAQRRGVVRVLRERYNLAIGRAQRTGTPFQHYAVAEEVIDALSRSDSDLDEVQVHAGAGGGSMLFTLHDEQDKGSLRQIAIGADGRVSFRTVQDVPRAKIAEIVPAFTASLLPAEPEYSVASHDETEEYALWRRLRMSIVDRLGAEDVFLAANASALLLNAAHYHVDPRDLTLRYTVRYAEVDDSRIVVFLIQDTSRYVHLSRRKIVAYDTGLEHSFGAPDTKARLDAAIFLKTGEIPS